MRASSPAPFLPRSLRVWNIGSPRMVNPCVRSSRRFAPGVASILSGSGQKERQTSPRSHPAAVDSQPLQPEFLPIRAGRDPDMALEQAAEEGDIAVAHGVTDLLHGAMVALQQAFGGGDAQLLHVLKRLVARGILEATNKVAQAHAHAPG